MQDHLWKSTGLAIATLIFPWGNSHFSDCSRVQTMQTSQTTYTGSLIRLGVQRVEDPHHPRGYRELRSPAEMRKLLNRKIVQQARICAICQEDFADYNDVVPDHKNPKGMGGAWRDDH